MLAVGRGIVDTADFVPIDSSLPNSPMASHSLMVPLIAASSSSTDLKRAAQSHAKNFKCSMNLWCNKEQYNVNKNGSFSSICLFRYLPGLAEVVVIDCSQTAKVGRAMFLTTVILRH